MFRRLILSILLTTFTASAHSEPCKSLRAEAEALDMRVPVVLGLIQSKVTPALVSGETTPRWQDFEDLSSIITQVRNIKSDLAAKGQLEAAMKVVTDAAAEIKLANAFQSLAAAGALPPPSGDSYRPTEYELKRLYRKLLLELNRQLPRSLAIKFRRLNPDLRRGRVTERTALIAKRAREVFQSLIATTGEASVEQVVAKVAANPANTPLLNAMRDGQIEVSIRRPESGRWWVPKVGFQNQFVTGSSRGANDPNSRNIVEGSSLQMTAAEYAVEDAETKPKYGSVRPAPTSGLKPANSDATYGADVYILKIDALKDRLTWTQFDSRYRQLVISNITESKANAWDRTFIPWEHNALMVPFMVAAQKGYPGTVGSTAKPEGMATTVAIPSGNYIETQIFGALDLTHVKAFEFTTKPPEGEFLAELQKNGIEIRDGRSWPPKPWSP